MSKRSYIDDEISLDTLKAYLSWKLSDRDRSSEREYINLLEELLQNGPRNFRELDLMVSTNIDWINEEEKHIPDFVFDIPT